MGFGFGSDRRRGVDDSILFFFIAVIIFGNCGLFNEGSELLFFFLLLDTVLWGKRQLFFWCGSRRRVIGY